MKHFTITLSLIFLISCTSGVLFKSYNKLDDMEWSKSQEQQFSFENPTDTVSYNVMLEFRYAQGFALQKMDVAIVEKAPDGTTTTIPLTFEVRNSKGEYIGDGSGDIWDLEIPIKQNQKLQKGSYTYTITQSTRFEKVQMVMEVGLSVKK